MNLQVIKREQLVASACLADEEGRQPGSCVCTALAYWPYWESPEALKIAEAVTKCIHKGWRLKPKNVKLLLEPDFKPWVDHQTFSQGLPYSCVEDEARQLLPFYRNKRIVESVGLTYQKMLDKPELAEELALNLRVKLEQWV